jgi:X-linked retinitis pigmentosa GTPase regulator
VNTAVFDTLTDSEQFFHIAKNVCHIAFNHVRRGEDKENKKLWAVAASAVVNQLLEHDGNEIPEGMVKMKNADKYTVEQVYEKLLEKNVNANKYNTEDYEKWYPKMRRVKKFLTEMLKAGGENDQLHPTGKGQKPDDKKNGGKGKDDKGEPEQGQEQEREQEREQGQEQKQEQGEYDERDFKKDSWENDLEKMQKETDEKWAGEGAGNKYMQMGAVGQAEKVVNWKRLLREAIETEEEIWGHKFSTRHNNWASRIEDKEIDEKILTEVVVDTSGSVSDELLHCFLSQLKTIIRESDLKVGCFDDAFYGFADIKSAKDIDNFVIKGRGGTNFDIAVNAFSKYAENKIVFTDGYAPMPEKNVKAIWVVYGDEKIQPEGGTVIMASEQEIMKNTKTENIIGNEM